ncbi:MAG: hypothetical protein ACOYVD_02765 [Bacillota bacterium]
MNQFQPPKNIEELKSLIKQFEMFLTDENKKVINDIIGEIESSGGIQNREQMEQLLQKLLAKLGMPPM